MSVIVIEPVGILPVGIIILEFGDSTRIRIKDRVIMCEINLKWNFNSNLRNDLLCKL